MRSICLFNPGAWIQLSQPVGSGYIDYNEKHVCESNGFNLGPKYCK